VANSAHADVMVMHQDARWGLARATWLARPGSVPRSRKNGPWL